MCVGDNGLRYVQKRNGTKTHLEPNNNPKRNMKGLLTGVLTLISDMVTDVVIQKRNLSLQCVFTKTSGQERK